jgi:hypothetical protein
MKIFRTMIGVGTQMLLCDTIEHEGGLWLVPHWLEDIAKKARMPTRIIRMDSLPHQALSAPYPADFVLNAPIPKDVIDGVNTFSQGVQYEVVESPPIRFPSPPKHLH